MDNANLRAKIAQQSRSDLLLRMEGESDRLPTKSFKNAQRVAAAQKALDRINSGEMVNHEVVRVPEYIHLSCGVRTVPNPRSDRRTPERSARPAGPDSAAILNLRAIRKEYNACRESIRALDGVTATIDTIHAKNFDTPDKIQGAPE